MHHLVFRINFQIHSVSLTIVVSIHLLIHFSTRLNSRHPSLIHSFTPGSKPTFSTNPFHRRFLLPTGLPHDNGTGPDLSRSSFYFLVLHFNFLFVPCGRLIKTAVRCLDVINSSKQWKLMDDEVIVTRAGMIQELVMVRDGL